MLQGKERESQERSMNRWSVFSAICFEREKRFPGDGLKRREAS